jgi:flagellar hook-length control protein FliK
MLSQEIKNHASDFVKTGSIVLRDNDSGSIRLVLNPKDLGDVKIHLQLTDNTIAARISVSNKEAYDAFKSSIDALKQAFNDSGFSTGEFNLSWAGSGAQNGGQQRGYQEHQELQTMQTVAGEYARAIPDSEATAEKALIGRANYAVNIMA